MRHEDELPRLELPKQQQPGRRGSSISAFSTHTQQPLSFSRRRGASFSIFLTVPSPSFQRERGVAITPSPAVPSPLSAGLFSLSRDFPAPPKRLSLPLSDIHLASTIASPADEMSIERRQSLLPGGLQSLESLFDASRQSHDAPYGFAGPADRQGVAEEYWQTGSAYTSEQAASDPRQSPGRQRIVHGRSSPSTSRCGYRAPSRQGDEKKHRRSGTLASLATVATSCAQTVYEDAVERLSGDDADSENSNVTYQDLVQRAPQPLPSKQPGVNAPGHSGRTGRVRLSFNRFRSASPLHSPKESITGSASSSLEPYSPISPLDPLIRTPSALARQLSRSTSSQHKKSRSESSLSGDKRSGPRQLILTPDVAAKMSLAEMAAWRRDSIFSHGDDEEHLQQQHFSLEEEMETLARLDGQLPQEQQNPYAALYSQLAISTNGLRDVYQELPSSRSPVLRRPEALSIVAEEALTTPMAGQSPRSLVAPTRTAAGHPYAGTYTSSSSGSFVSLPHSDAGRPDWQRSRSMSNVNDARGLSRFSAASTLPVPEERTDAASFASWSHTMATSLAALGVRSPTSKTVLPATPAASPRTPGASFSKASEKPQRERAVTEGAGQTLREKRAKEPKTPRSLKARASMWLLKSPTKAAQVGKEPTRSKSISGPLHARHVASGTLAPHVLRESPFGRRSESPVQGYIAVPLTAGHGGDSELVPALPALFDSPALSSTSSAQSDGPATPVQHQGPMQLFWAASLEQAEAGEVDDHVESELITRSISKAGKMPISQAERERRRSSRRPGPGSRPGSRSSGHLLA